MADRMLGRSSDRERGGLRGRTFGGSVVRGDKRGTVVGSAGRVDGAYADALGVGGWKGII